MRDKTAEDRVTLASLEGLTFCERDIVVFYFNCHPPMAGELYSRSFLTDDTALGSYAPSPITPMVSRTSKGGRSIGPIRRTNTQHGGCTRSCLGNKFPLSTV